MIWRIYSHFYDSLLITPPYKKLLIELNERANIKPEETVVDLGSGTGNFAQISKRNDSGYYCIDGSPEMLKISKRKVPHCNHILSDLNSTKIPIKNNHADKVVSNNSVYAVNDIDNLFNEVYRILKPNGLFVFSNSIRKDNKPIIIEILRSISLIKFISNFLTYVKLIGVLLINIFISNKYETQFYSKESLIAALEKNHFKVIENTYSYEGINVLIVARKQS